MRTLKEEAFRRILVPFRLDAMRRQLVAYVHWYNAWRPHQTLRGATPAEVLSGTVLARQARRLETRERWPLARGDPPLVQRVNRLRLGVEHVEGEPHLPIVTLKRVA